MDAHTIQENIRAQRWCQDVVESSHQQPDSHGPWTFPKGPTVSGVAALAGYAGWGCLANRAAPAGKMWTGPNPEPGALV